MRTFRLSIRYQIVLGTLIFAAYAGAFFAYSAHAQFAFPAGQIDIATDPSFPGPSTEFTASLNAYSFDVSGASIRWYVDGEEVASARDSITLPLETGELGSSMTIRAVFTPPGGASIDTTRTLVASEIDLIIEADTSVPAFYEGRALPSDGASIRAVAIPHVTGTARDADLFYTWELGNQVLFGGPARGRQAAELEMPSVPKVLSVSVSNAAGTELGRKAIRLAPVKTELHFYEDNPLRGMGRKAVGESVTLVGDETVVRAEPYFVSSDVARRDALYTWRINGSVTDNPSDDPRSITLRKTGGSGSAEIGFKFTNERAVLQRLSGSFTIFFD